MYIDCIAVLERNQNDTSVGKLVLLGTIAEIIDDA